MEGESLHSHSIYMGSWDLKGSLGALGKTALTMGSSLQPVMGVFEFWFPFLSVLGYQDLMYARQMLYHGGLSPLFIASFLTLKLDVTNLPRLALNSQVGLEFAIFLPQPPK